MLSRAARRGVCAFTARPTSSAICRAFSALPQEAAVGSIDALSDEEWTSRFLEATSHIDSNTSHKDSAEAMRALVKQGLISYTTLRDYPERFFKAHRLLARHAVEHGPGFWIRFTVHYNLCFGTVLAVGGDEQVEALTAVQESGALGCFALTERFAGVQSGLVVQTEATWDDKNQQYIIHTPSPGAAKNWISQGFTADKAVVVANLSVDDKVVGPHAFLMDLRKDGQLVDGVSVGDMGIKTTGNDLDNAWISFDNVRIPKDALLNAHADVNDAGEYTLKSDGVPPFAMIGQRLYTGRVCVAQAALEYRRKLFEVANNYCSSKPVWSPFAPAPAAGELGPVLSEVPQLKAIFEEGEKRGAEMDEFVARCESELTKCLVDGRVPPMQLAEAIAIAKVKAVETSIDLCGRLKQDIGSFALMGDAGFVHLDFLTCCKFAEGDSRILMQKMARDRMRRFGKDVASGVDHSDKSELFQEEQRICAELGAAMAGAGNDKAAQQKIWDEQWVAVYQLAEACMARGIKEFMDDTAPTAK